jgi:hypothetical protein
VWGRAGDEEKRDGDGNDFEKPVNAAVMSEGYHGCWTEEEYIRRCMTVSFVFGVNWDDGMILSFFCFFCFSACRFALF